MTNLACLALELVDGNSPGHAGGCITGDIRVRVHRDPDTLVGMDLAYISADLAAQTAEDALFIDGLPVLAIEILSPSDTIEGIAEKAHAYLDAGVPAGLGGQPVLQGG